AFMLAQHLIETKGPGMSVFSNTVAAALLAATLAVSGCGGGGSLDNTGATAQPTKSFEDAMVDYSACMREHGVDMPDPTFDSAGASSVVIKGEGNDGPPADTDKFNEAATACQSEGLGGGFRLSGGSDGSSSGVGSVSAAAGQ